MTIPLSKPFITGRELHYVRELIASGNLSSDGEFSRRCSHLLEERLHIAKVFMTPSCTAALEMAALLCGLGPGDEAILPSFTFVSTANAIVAAGARPVFVDIRRDTLNLDVQLVEQAITAKTKAIFPVHYAGVGCEMDALTRLAARHRLFVVEDAAQAVNAFYDDRALGGIGQLGAYSFHSTKNLTSGEGGALCINDPKMIARAEIIREKGTNRAQFACGRVDKYTWVDRGSSHIPSEVACAFLLGQLEAVDEITARRRAIFERYMEHLSPVARQNLLGLPFTPQNCRSNAHTFHIMLPNSATRDALLRYLGRNGIRSASHYVPLHSSPMGQKFGYVHGDLPITEDLSGRLLRLPLYPDLSEQEQLSIVDHTTRFLRKPRRVAARASGGLSVAARL